MSDPTAARPPAHARFRARLASGERLVGTFLKTPTPHAAEMVAPLGFDFVVIDQEHGVFDRQGIDATLCAARGADIAALVRVPGPDAILSVLDCGATGVLVPHVSSLGKAAEVASLCRYRGGSRGFATTTRAGGYGAVPAAQHIATADASVTVVAQIEDREALEQIDAIAALDGIDCLFIGRADLSVALGDLSPESAALRDAVAGIAQASRRAGKPIGVFVSDEKEAAWLGALGATLFVLGSDQTFMRQAASAGAASLRRVFRSLDETRSPPSDQAEPA